MGSCVSRKGSASVFSATPVASPDRMPSIPHSVSVRSSSAETEEALEDYTYASVEDIFSSGLDMSPVSVGSPERQLAVGVAGSPQVDASEALFGALAASAAKLSLGKRVTPSAIGQGHWGTACRASSKMQVFEGDQNTASSGRSGGSSLIAAFYVSEERRRVTW